MLKLAHLAELYGTNIEMNAQGGLFGHIHAHLGCCIDNTDFYELSGQSGDVLYRAGQQWGLLNAPHIEEGHIAPNDTPGWGAAWDEDKFQAMVVERHED